MDDKKNPWTKTDKWEAEIEALKSFIAKTELVEMIKWGGPMYTVNGKNVLGIGGFKSYVGIWFFQGALLKDPLNVLVNASEGVTKAMRQWRFTSVDEIRNHEKDIERYIAEAIANEKAGLAIKPEKKQTVISDFFREQLEQNPEVAEAFQKFTPGKQREFLEHVDSAKREETKVARFEKIKPMILGNIGLNDKYRK